MIKTPEHVAILVDVEPENGPGDVIASVDRFADRLRTARTLISAAADSAVRYLTLCPETPAGTFDHAEAARLTQALAADCAAAERRGLIVSIMQHSGRADLTRATRELAARVRAGTLHPDDLTLELLQKTLASAALPDPDLIILCGRRDREKSSGVSRPQRLSGCLLYECAYAEFHFCEASFAALTLEGWHRALGDFSQRDRRFGRAPEPVSQAPARFTAAEPAASAP